MSILPCKKVAVLRPIYTARDCPERTNCCHSCSAKPSASCAVRKVVLEFLCRRVRDTCNVAAAAEAAVIPGITSVAIPALAAASNSSSSLPNKLGSPPFRRTTRKPAAASRTKWALISCWLTAGPNPFLPTLINLASLRASSSTSLPTKRSYTTTSAS